MSIVRISHNKENPYVMLNKAALEDKELSWAGKGLWAYLMSKPDHWNISVPHLSTIYEKKGGGERAIYALINELIEAGYCSRKQALTEKGQFSPIEYVITELKNKVPHRSQADAAEPHAAESAYSNKGALVNKEKQQQANARAQDAAAFFSCLDKIDIPLQDKIDISKKYEEPMVEHALKWMAAKKPGEVSSFIRLLIFGLNKLAQGEKLDIVKPVVEQAQDNVTLAMQMAKKTILPKGVNMEILNRYVEIGNGLHQPSCIAYTEKGFKEQLENAIRKWGGNFRTN